MTSEQAQQNLSRVAASWRVRTVPPSVVIDLACDALVAGLDSEALRELAGLSGQPSEYEDDDIFARALRELRIEGYGWDPSDSDQRSAASLYYATPEEAACAGLPPAANARVLGVEIIGCTATVNLALAPHYDYYAICRRTQWGWVETASHN